MKRPTAADNRPAKEGFFGSIWNNVTSFLNPPPEPKKLVLIGRASYTQEMVPEIKNTIQFLEIEYFIINEKALLAQNNSAQLKAALNKLKKQDLEKNGNSDYQRKEELLDTVNTLIIRKQVQTSKSTDGKALNCNNAFLTRIPEEIFREDPVYWQQVENISLRNNRLSTLPIQIRQLTALKKLDITGNTIGTLPSTMNELAMLEEVHLPTDTVKYYEPQTPFLPSKAFAKTVDESGICFKVPSKEKPVSLPRKIQLV